MDSLAGTFYWTNVKVTVDQNFEVAYAQLWLIVVFEIRPIRAQTLGCHVYSNSVHVNIYGSPDELVIN